MSTAATTHKYYVLSAKNPRRMLLASLEDPGMDDNWLWGRRFVEQPPEPIIVGIVPGYERAELLDYFGTPPVMSDRFHSALVSAGVDNLEVFEAVLEDENEQVRYTGFKAVNIVGLISAAGVGTVYDTENASRKIDAGIDKLDIDSDAARGALMFRLAEYVGAVVVHEKVKAALEAAGFPHIEFELPDNFVS